MSLRAACRWTWIVFVAALFLGGCGGPRLAQTQQPVLDRVLVPPLEVNRARIVELQARQQVQPGFDAGPELLSAYDNAQAVGDREGAGFAAALLINSGGVSAELVQELGEAVVDGLEVSEDASMQSSMRAALTTLCARGLRFEGACQSTHAFVEIDPEIVGVWIEQGYRHLLMEDLEKAEAVVEDLRAMLTDGFVEQYALRAADIVFLDAALLGVQGAEGESAGHLERALEGVHYVEKSLEGEAFSEHIFQLSEQFRVRGLDWLAVVLLQKYVGQVDDAQEKAVRVVEYARFLHESGRWSELLELGAGEVDSAEWSELALYRSDAAYQLGDRKLAVRLEEEAVKGGSIYASDAVFGLMSLVVRVNARRGDWLRAWGIGRSALSISQDKMKEFSPAVQASLAGLLGARAEVAAMLGEHDEARQLFDASLAIFAELPVEASARVRVHVLEAWGRTAPGGEVGAHQIGDAMDQLALFRTQLHHVFEPVAERDARVALIRLALLVGSFEEAHAQFLELAQAGLSSGASPAVDVCLRGKIGFYRFAAVEDQASVIGDLERCADIGLEAETRAEAAWLAALLAPDATMKDRLASTLVYEKTLGKAQVRERRRVQYFGILASLWQESVNGSERSEIGYLLYDLRPVDAQAALVRIFRENPDMDETLRMDLEYLRMQVLILLGQWHELAHAAAAYETYLMEQKDQSNLAAVRVMKKLFSL